MSSPNTAAGNPAPGRPTGRPAARPKPLKQRFHLALRWLHVYTSMLCLLLLLFFALSGVTLNHPDWTFGGAERRQELSGTLPADWRRGGHPDWLKVVEAVRADHELRGRATDLQEDGDEDTLSFQAPGYSADVIIETASGRYTVSTLSQGFVAVINDLHRGRHAGTSWSWVLDLSGGFLALISLTGLGIMVYMKKLRRAALLTIAAGTVISLLLAKLAL
ncbi:PepSY-associated TM helix domain-containing protein [Deinococcus sp. UYEF24]